MSDDPVKERPTGASQEPCPACGSGMELPEDMVLGEVLWCENCGAELEVISTEPLRLELFEEEEK